MFLALTEIRRSLGRFALLTSAVALLVLLLLFFQAVGGTLTLGLTGAFESTAADVVVYDERARSNPLASVLDPASAEEIGLVEGVAAAAPIGIGIFAAEQAGADGEGQLDVALFGGDPDGPTRPATVADGRLPEAPDEALFSGSSLDESFEIGDTITVAEQQLTVVGTADDAPFNVLPTFYVPFETYVATVRARAGAPIDVPASIIGVAVAEDADPAAIAALVGGEVQGVDGLTRDQAVAALPGVDQVSQSFNILNLLLLIVVTIVTGVFFLILTVQKAQALVLLRAVGASRRDVVTPLLIQVVGVVGVGSAVGAAAASGLLAAARDTFGSTLSGGSVVGSVAAILLLGVLASLGAVRRVLRVDPVEAVNTGGI